MRVRGAPPPWMLMSPPESAMTAPARPRLLAQLDAAVRNYPVTLLAAPSGYDKTTLLSAWALRSTAHTAWLTLTAHDDMDEEHLLTGIRSALLQLDGVAHSTSGSAPSGDVWQRLTAVVEDLGAPVTLVIDDAHHAGAALTPRVLHTLIARTEGRVRIIAAGAPVLLTWFVGAVASQRATALSARDLAVTVEEVIAEYAHWDAHITEAEASALITSSSGWPIAARLHRLTAHAQDSRGATSGQLYPEPEHAGLLTDYIADHVLGRLPPALAEFVLSATTCSLLTPALAQALTGEPDSERFLEECIAHGLFLTRYRDAEGNALFRWNEEFATRCRDILARSNGVRRRALETLAARWLAPHSPAEAITHALRAGADDVAVDIIRTMWLRVITESGARQLNAQCLRLSSELRNHPELLVIRAACLNLLDDATGSTLLHAQATATGGSDPNFVATEAFAALFLTDDPAVLASAADRARTVMTHASSDPSLNAYRVFLLGWVELRLRRDPPSAVRLLQSAVLEADAAARPILARRARGNLAFALSYGGRLEHARRLLDDVDDAADHAEDWFHYDGGIALFARGFVDYWQGRTGDARAAFRTLLAQGGHDASYAALARVYTALSAAEDGNPDEWEAARAQLDGISAQRVHGLPWPTYRAIADARLLSASGDHERALAMLATITDMDDVPLVSVIAAEVLRGAGRSAEAIRVLARISPQARRVSLVASSGYLTSALIAHEQGDATQSRRLFERALDAAIPEGILQPFTKRDARYRALLADHAAAGTAHGAFIAARITAFDAAAPDGAAVGLPLSAREREIFGYLCTTMTAEEIAQALFVSVNTIRTHQRAIYRKLGVANRREAIRFRT